MTKQENEERLARLKHRFKYAGKPGSYQYYDEIIRLYMWERRKI